MKTLVWTRHSSHTLTLFRDPAVQRLLAALAGGLLVLSLTSTVRAQDTALAAARDLYAAARYDEALSALDELRGSQPLDARTERSVEQYRSLVLLALGREPEAEAAISNVITSDPLYRPDEMEVAPRVRAAFQEVRSRLLPEIVRDQYASAKAAFDDRDFDLAGNRFTEVLSLLDEPELAGSLEDLRLLASGFLELSMAATAQAAAAEGESAPVPGDPPLPDPFRIYTIDHPGITPAEPIRQDVPRLPQQILANARSTMGLLEIVIDEAGEVDDVRLRISIHPLYDNMLVSAARRWRYRPAILDRTPVKFRRLVQVSVR